MNGRTSAVLVLIVALAARLPVFLSSHERAMSPDEAHFLNIARSVSRGQGFSNPAAWPAWLAPDRLPAPETFKDPGLPYAIAALTPLAGDPFRAGVLLALIAGLILPLVVQSLARRLTGDRATALMAGLLVAASPLLINASARVLSESLFVLVLTLAFRAAAPRAADEHGAATPAGTGAALAAGALLGAAFLVREQAAIALPALLWLLLAEAPPRTWPARTGAALAGLLLAASPLLIRNLRVFGAPLHDDATAFLLWPYWDPIEFSHGLERPPSALAWMVAHPGAVATHVGANLFFFVRHAVPRELFGITPWLAPLVVGAALTFRRLRTWGFAWAYLVPCVIAMAAMSWNTRYFASTVPILALFAALGTMGIVRRAGIDRGAPLARWAVVALIAILLAVPIADTWRTPREPAPAEIEAAVAARDRLPLAPNEAVMAVTTSYWSWFLDRPSVHLPIAEASRVAAIARRYRVRWAALPTSRLAELGSRYPEGRLPAWFVPAWTDSAHDLSVFAVRP